MDTSVDKLDGKATIFSQSNPHYDLDMRLNRADHFEELESSDFKRTKREKTGGRKKFTFVVIYLILLTALNAYLLYKVFTLQTELHSITEGSAVEEWAQSSASQVPLGTGKDHFPSLRNSSLETASLRESLGALQTRVDVLCGDDGGLGQLRAELGVVNASTILLQNRLLNLNPRPGLPGTPGPQGPKGDSGSDGVSGTKGEQGAQGNPGLPGLAGVQGEKGDLGEPGDIGLHGADGERGNPGPTGSPGPSGPAGQPGLTGSKGDPGERGTPGDPGIPGVKGQAGSAGLPGLMGQAGEKGDAGDPGKPGPQGQDGSTGPKGSNGNTGTPGTAGQAGAAGVPGVRGEQGPKGDTGVTGPQGIPGLQGPPGPRGVGGLTGLKGATGSPGDKGSQGIPGAPGIPGLKGNQGASGPQGAQGTAGPQGPQGEKGGGGEARPAVVRIAGGGSRGRVEVFSQGQWGTVCDDDFDTVDGSVVCRMLGYIRASSVFTAPPGTGRILLDNLKCTGRESSIFLCPHSGLGVHNCNHQEDVGVTCA